MPDLHENEQFSKKRKRTVPKSDEKSDRRMRKNSTRDPNIASSHSTESQVLFLEKQIQESQRHYNNIVTLHSLATSQVEEEKQRLAAVAALCRVFCRLLADARLSKLNGASQNDLVVVDWLKARYVDLQNFLLECVGSTNKFNLTALTLCMELIKAEISNPRTSPDQLWRTGLFSKMLDTILETSNIEVLHKFVDSYAQQFDDVRHYTFVILAESLAASGSSPFPKKIASNILLILSSIDVVLDVDMMKRPLWCAHMENIKRSMPPYSAHRKRAQQAWLLLLNCNLDKEQRKTVLNIMTHRIVPWFQNVELLMDFLVDSFDTGGATSLLSLSGLFYLMKEKNLDYPDFYLKLYSLLDTNLLHSKHRSRFLRLLNTFTSSTHLPAALVASFIKRLSRLALHAPPAAIVAIVPWVYNMLQSHPTCTFMIHREPRSTEEKEVLDDEGMDDPFHMDEQNPMYTGGIESSLWELETLQSHYHPNVASLAKIISEQFTKGSYNLEDFLDHSYSSLIETELAKELKKTPVIEFEIPKKIFTYKGEAALGNLEAMMINILKAA